MDSSDEKSAKKSVLMLSSRMPYPPVGGDRLKNYNLIKILSKYYKIHLIVLTDTEPTEEEINFCKTYCHAFKIFHKNKIQSIFNVFKYFFNQKPLQINYYYFNDVQSYVNYKIKDVDFIINTLVRTSEYILSSHKPKFLDMVDSISMNYERSAQKVTSFIWRLIYQYEVKLLRNYEKKCVQSYKNTFFVNYSEADYWSKHGETTWIPNGVNETLFAYEKKNLKYQNYVAFFGKMDYSPNIEAVVWFIEKVFPHLHKDIKFIIVGGCPTDKIKSYKNDRIEVTDYVDDPYEILNSTLCNVAPMQTGGGIQNKVLEAMALGSINIVSYLGAEPIKGAEENVHLLIRNSPEEFIQIINKIYQDLPKYQFLKVNSKHLIKSKYTWGNYEKNLVKMLESSL